MFGTDETPGFEQHDEDDADEQFLDDEPSDADETHEQAEIDRIDRGASKRLHPRARDLARHSLTYREAGR